MKTLEEIEQLAEQWFENANTDRWGGEVDGFIQGYTQCQQDIIIDLAKKLVKNQKDTIRPVYSDNPLEFLEQFNDLIPVEKNENIFYVDKDRLPLFFYHREEKNVNINNERIWSFFSNVIELEYIEIQDIIKKWLEETYNLKGLTPRILKYPFFYFCWDKPII